MEKIGTDCSSRELWQWAYPYACICFLCHNLKNCCIWQDSKPSVVITTQRNIIIIIMLYS